MGREDWYRRTTWSQDDQREFFDRLKRSRETSQKAQYIRIQAVYLQTSGLYTDALQLLSILHRDYPGEESQATAALMQTAECLWAIDDRPGALQAYQQALAAQRHHPGMISLVALSFAERFHDYDNGAYRELLLNELGDELERIHSLTARDKLRYGAVMVPLLTSLGFNEEVQTWQRIVEEARQQFTLDSIRVGNEPRKRPGSGGETSTATTARAQRGREKSDFVRALDEIQHQLEPTLRRHGFRVRGRTFNRTTADGLTQVVNLQTGVIDPPGTINVPGLTSSKYGQFTVNLGVHVPEVELWTNGLRKKSFIQDYDCCIRARLGDVSPEGRDIWWWIERREDLVSELRQRLEAYALPYLDRFETRDAILTELGAGDPSTGGNPSRIICAIILTRAGAADQARHLLKDQANDPDVRARSPQHAEYVRELAKRLGLGDLA